MNLTILSEKCPLIQCHPTKRHHSDNNISNVWSMTNNFHAELKILHSTFLLNANTDYEESDTMTEFFF